MAPKTTHSIAPSEQTLEGLSSLIDDEVSRFESRRLLDMANDPALEAKWQSYHLTGALMRKELEAAPLKDLSLGIAAALANEPALTMADSPHKASHPTQTNGRFFSQHWRDMAAKSAIAASVAFAVIVGVQYSQTGGLKSEPEFAVQSAPVVAPSGFDVPSPVARNVSLGSLAEPQQELQSAKPSQQQFLSNAQVEAELQLLFLEHAQLSSQNGKFGLMPMARAAKMQPADQ